MRNLTMLKLTWGLTAVLAIVASLSGLMKPDIYVPVVRPDLMTGVWSQDLLSLFLAAMLLLLAVTLREYQFKKLALVLGIVGYLFYGYGIYVIEQLYTRYYLLYVAIFGISIYSFIWGLFSIECRRLETMKLDRWMNRISVGFFLLVPALFSSLWLTQIMEQIRLAQKLEFTQGVYILDLSIVMPLFLITAVNLVRGNSWGYMLAPVLYVKGFTVLFPVGLGGIMNPAAALGESLFYLVFALVFLVLLVLYMRSWRMRG